MLSKIIADVTVAVRQRAGILIGILSDYLAQILKYLKHGCESLI